MKLSGPDALAQTLAFANKEIPAPRGSLAAGTDLRADLRMIWEDAESFADTFFRAFEVDPGDFEIGRYFPREGSLLTAVTGLWRKPAPPPRLTLGMFAQAAADGVWNSGKLARTTD